MGLKKTRLILLEGYLVLLLCLGCPGLRWMFSDPDLLQNFWLFHLRLGMWTFHLSKAFTLPLYWALGRGVQMRPSPPILQSHHYVYFPHFSGRQHISKEYTWQDFRTELMQSRKVFRRNSVIFGQFSKRDTWGVKRYSEPPFMVCLPIRQEILNVSQIAITFHELRPPFFIQTWLIATGLQMSLFHAAECSFGNPMCFWSVRCWRTMIPG